MNYQRGYIQFGKDRQHPVSDPDADITREQGPTVWMGHHDVRAWYVTVPSATWPVYPPIGWQTD